MANPDFNRAPLPHAPSLRELERDASSGETVAVTDDAFNDIDVTTITRSSGYVTQIVYTNGAKTATVDYTRTENNQITSIAMTIS